MLFKKTKSNTIEVLISKALIDSYINHHKFVSVNNVLKEHKWCRIYYMKTMETYCVSCKKNTMNKSSSVRRTEQNRLMLLSNCAFCTKKKSRFFKNQEANRLELH